MNNTIVTTTIPPRYESLIRHAPDRESAEVLNGWVQANFGESVDLGHPAGCACCVPVGNHQHPAGCACCSAPTGPISHSDAPAALSHGDGCACCTPTVSTGHASGCPCCSGILS